MKRTSLLTVILLLVAAHLRAGDGESFLASVLEVGQRQNFRRTVSIDPSPTRQPLHKSGKASVSLKLPSLGEKKEGRMRIIEVDGANDGSLNFDMSRTELTEPDIGIPGLVSPELLALDQYNFTKSETPSAKSPLLPDLDAAHLDAVRDSQSGPLLADNVLRRDSLPLDESRRSVHYARIELPSVQTVVTIKERDPTPTFPQGSLKPPPSDTAFLSPALPGTNHRDAPYPQPDSLISPDLPDLTPMSTVRPEPASARYEAYSRDHLPTVPDFEWPSSPASVKHPAIEDANGFTSMREFRNALAPLYRSN